MRFKRGQAAMEFLMTYGWAILAAIIAVGVLAYFGVFSPGKLVGSSAVLNPPLGVDEFNIIDNDATNCGGNDCINMEIIQNVGETISAEAATITLTSGATGTCSNATTLPGTWSSGNVQSISFNCGSNTTWNSGDTLAGDIQITYRTTGSSLNQISTGSLRGVSQ